MNNIEHYNQKDALDIDKFVDKEIFVLFTDKHAYYVCFGVLEKRISERNNHYYWLQDDINHNHFFSPEKTLQYVNMHQGWRVGTDFYSFYIGETSHPIYKKYKDLILSKDFETHALGVHMFQMDVNSEYGLNTPMLHQN